MIMKVIVNKKVECNKYPYIGINKFSDHIVYFTANLTGLTLEAGCSVHKIGDWSETWNEPVFERYEGNIILSNE